MNAEVASLLAGSADEVAPRLLGMQLSTWVAGTITSITLSEVEAYLPDDPASHTFGGPTPRNAPMFGPAGGVYVYRSYGIHWCMNIVTGRPGDGQAVLIRGGLPATGIGTMIERRGRTDHLADGPGKVCQALGVDGTFTGTSLGDRVHLSGDPDTSLWTATPRIGISKATDRELRFVALPAGEGRKNP